MRPGRRRIPKFFCTRAAISWRMHFLRSAKRPRGCLTKKTHIVYNSTVITVVDYGAGNIMSVVNSLRHIGVEAKLTDAPEQVGRADCLIVPGVGNFGAAKRVLDQKGLTDALRHAAGRGVPMLGICLGLQLFLSSSEESPGVGGLGLLDGQVTQLATDGRKLPHIGWTSVSDTRGLLEGFDGRFFYFVHSFGAHSADCSATAEYGETFAAAVERDNVCAVQFHPEKSGAAGLRLLQRFCRRAGETV